MLDSTEVLFGVWKQRSTSSCAGSFIAWFSFKIHCCGRVYCLYIISSVSCSQMTSCLFCIDSDRLVDSQYTQVIQFCWCVQKSKPLLTLHALWRELKTKEEDWRFGGRIKQSTAMFSPRGVTTRSRNSPYTPTRRGTPGKRGFSTPRRGRDRRYRTPMDSSNLHI